MSLETATYINGLVPTNPLGSDPLSDADGHLRLIKAALKATFPNITGEVTASQSVLNALSGGTGDPGAIQYFARSTAPTGYLKANGAAVSRSTYAGLFSAIGVSFGAGDGTTTFNLPDLRGEFLRAWDDGRGVDSGRSLGSSQSGAFASHNHYFESYNLSRAAFDPGGLPFLFADSPPHYTASVGGSETRPRNIALLACIKY